MPADLAFSQRIHEALLPVTERYVEESGRPDRVYAAQFDPDEALFDFTQTHFTAKPVPLLSERAGRFVTGKIVGIPNSVLDGVLVPAFAKRSDEIIGNRLERPTVQLADHTPPLGPVGTQFAGNLALANHVAGRTADSRLAGLVRQSHGIGTVGYRLLGVRPIPKGPGLLVGKTARWLTNTHYSIPSTPQYYGLDLARDDRKRYSAVFAANLIAAMQQQPPKRLPQRYFRGAVGPEHLFPECVINPVGTKEVHEGGRVVIPRAHWATGMLINGLGAAILPVYTSFKFDSDGKIIGGYCDVGDMIEPPAEGEGGNVVDAYLTELAAYRSEREDKEVVYAEAA